MELNERIIQARKQAGLTQEQLGERLGVSRQAVSKWESGQANPDVAYIVEMCKLFEVSTDWLLTGFGPADKENAERLCPNCGQPAAGQDRFCSQCGTAMEDHNLTGRCPDCGALLSSESTYCTKCGKHLNETYSLYLRPTEHDADLVADQLYKLLLSNWVTPAFPCEEVTMEIARHLVINAAPLVLCQGLSYEQALKCTEYFSEFPNTVKIYRDSDIIQEHNGILHPGAPAVSITPSDSHNQEREPLSGGAIFGLVVLGVIVAIVLMSVF